MLDELRPETIILGHGEVCDRTIAKEEIKGINREPYSLEQDSRLFYTEIPF